MADLKDLAEQYGLEDYEQLLGGYPNAEKFITGLKDAAVRAVPTTEQMRDPNFIIDTAGLGGAIKAYHGSPHLFDRFDMSKLGTGEGAQSYGHGLYFAQDPSIAEIYRKNLAEKHESPKSAIYETSIQWPNAEREAMDPLGEHHLLDWYQPAEGYVQEAIPKKIKELRNSRDAIDSKYTDGDFNPDDLFANIFSFPSREDKTAIDRIAEEINMHKYMSNAFEKGAEGSVIYNKLIKMLGSPEKASEYLHSIDIPGIKYLDATSRRTDKGTRNFVTFGDEYPQIVKRAGSLDELKEKNLNKRLIEKYLSEGKLSPDGMAQYEQNALAMETPLLQRYNVENAEMQIPDTKKRAKSIGFMTQPSKEQYHLTRNDWENNIPDLVKSDLGFHTGSIDQANYRGNVFDKNAVGQSIIPIAPNKYTNYLKLKDLGSFHADSIAPHLENKKMLAKGEAKQIQNAIDDDWKLKLTAQYDQQMRDVLSQHDIDAIKYANEHEGQGLSYAHINPSMIRSRFAAFDPLRKNSSSIMASGLLGGLGLKYANDDDQGYAEGGIVKAQDQNENLGRLAEMLGSARDIGNEYKVPSWVPLAGGAGAGDLLMGRTPEEIENWSYGNAPMQIPEMSNVPQFKRGRAQSLADALTTLAPGVKATEGLPAGLSFIGPKSRNWDKVAAELAAKKLDEGADPAEVWREHLIGRMPDKTLFSEISDKEAQAIPKDKWSWGNTEDLRQGESRITDPVSSFLSHPELHNAYHGMVDFGDNNRRLLMNVSPERKDGFFGDNIIGVGMVDDAIDKSTAMHELQHAIQDREGWSQGGDLDSAASFYIENYLSPKLKELNNSINEGTKLRGNITNEDEYAANVLRHKQLVAEREKLNDEVSNIENNKGLKFRLYKRLAGEAQARATQDRLDMDMAQRRENYPLAGGKLSDIPLEELIYKYEGNGPSLSSKYNEMHPDKNYLTWDLTSDSHFDEEGYEMPGDPYVLIEKVYTHPDDRNKGVATRLMSDAMKEIESKHPNMPIKLSPIPLDKDTDIERLADFYKKFGFDEMPEGHMQKYAEGGSVDKDSLQLNKPQRTPSHPDKSHIVKTMVDGKEKIIRFGEQGAETAGKPKEGESDRMTAKRESFKARHAKNIAKGPSSAAYWANKVKWAEGGEVDIRDDEGYADDLARLKRAYENSNFGPNDSMIASTIRHPAEAVRRADDWLQEKERILSGRPYEDDFTPEDQALAGLDIAGLAETGSMPFAPISAGGTLGTTYIPEKFVDLYKLFQFKEQNPIDDYPLFVNADKPIPRDVWVPAEAGEFSTKPGTEDKVKSGIGPLAYRPGYHGGDLPIATHIGKGGKPPVYRPYNHRWSTVQFPDDVDWQSIANERGINKKGKRIPKEAHITDQIPFGGHYRYKTSPNMTGEWLISGDMKLGNHLTDDEVKAINQASGLGVEDLPRFHEYLNRNMGNPAELSRVIDSDAGKVEYFQMLKKAKDSELDDLMRMYGQHTDEEALRAMDKRYNKYLKKGYAEGGSVDAQDDEGYLDDLDRLKKAYERSNFGPNDSVIASTIHHPIEAAKRYGQHLNDMYAIATDQLTDAELAAAKDAGYDEESYPLYAMEHPIFRTDAQKAEAGMEFAGLAQTGAMPFAPESAGGVLGMLIKPMKASEAYGRIEGEKLHALETDRTKVGKGFLGGVGYTGLQHTSPAHAEVDSTWGVQTPSKAATIINGTVKPGQPDPVFTTFIGSPDQHKSNNLVFDLVHKNWKKALKDSDVLTPELIERMNERLATHKDYVDRKTGKPIFPADINVLSKNLKDYATTFDRRAALAEVLGGKGVGGKKGQIFDYDKVIRDTTDPTLLDAPTGALGNRLFTLNGGILTDRYDLNPAFPTILQGKDLGLVYQPVPRELVFKDFVNDIRQKTGRDPGYMHWTRGYPPSQLITEDLLTEMQRAGYAKGGEVSMEDLPFDDPDQLRLYHQAMKHYDDVIENTGASKKTGKGTARVNYSTLTKGDIDKENALHTLMANYGVDIGDLNLDAGLIKPMEADGLYIGDLTGSLPLGEGRASLGVQGMHSKYDDGLSGYTAGYTGKVGDGNLSARYFEPADHNSAGRQVQLEYALPFAKGGEVKDLHNKYEESDYGYGNRPDKTKKGLGYFGELERPDGTGVMTEYSIGVPIHGEEMDVPTLVPTLTPDEIRLILHMQDGEDMPRSIVHKAIDHAHQRLSEGKPIFATEEDLYAHGGIVDVLHNDAIEQIMKAFMDSMADDEEPSAPAVSIEITTQNTETPQRGKIPKSIAREAKHG